VTCLRGYLLQRASPPTEEDIDVSRLLGYDWRLLSANQKTDAASTSPASLTLLAVLWRVGVCANINDCWGDGGASMWSAWHLIEERDPSLTAAVKTGREGRGVHMKLSSYAHQPAFGLFFFFFLLLPHEESRVFSRGGEPMNWFLISCVKRPHIVDWLYVARWGCLSSPERRS